VVTAPTPGQLPVLAEASFALEAGTVKAMEKRRFRDRTEAGQVLADRLRKYAGREDVVVLALPRGGVPVAYEVAKALDAPLGVFVVRKLGVPGHEELAMGAIASGGLLVLDERLVQALGLDEEQLEQAIEKELRELERRQAAYGSQDTPRLAGKTVILVDDGLATGATMRAAALAVRRLNPKKVVVAVPVAAEETCDQFRDVVDEIACEVTPRPFRAVGLWYDDFSQTSDEEVRELVGRAAEGGETS
jgi:putative phosphoribosyl transferase